MEKKDKKNVLLIGASGGVARAFLYKMLQFRDEIGRLVLVDRRDHLLHDPLIAPHRIKGEFITSFIDVKNRRSDYLEILRSYDINIVIDLSINETLPILEATDALDISYINTGIVNKKGDSFSAVVLEIIRRKSHQWRSTHILCSGMNPGIVNMWVRRGIEKYGLPIGIVHFEYDTARPRQGWLPIITWSIDTFIDEIINDPAGYMEGADKLKLLYPNPLKNRVRMNDILRPIMHLSDYPRGFLLLHEENITLAQVYDRPSRFVFAVDPRTMDYLEDIYDKKGEIPPGTMKLGDNRGVPLRGSVTVGVLLEYPDRRLYFFNETSHGEISASSASCWQVAAGLYAALFSMLRDPLPNGIYFVEDLSFTSFDHLAEEILPFQTMEIAQPFKGRPLKPK
jgi:homospermidine synthase